MIIILYNHRSDSGHLVDSGSGPSCQQGSTPVFSPALMWIDHHSIEPTRIETTSTTRTTATARTTSPSLNLPFWTLSFGSTKKVHICNIGFHFVQKTHTSPPSKPGLAWINKHHRFMKNKGFGHLRTTLSTIQASKHVGFWGPMGFNVLSHFLLRCWNKKHFLCKATSGKKQLGNGLVKPFEIPEAAKTRKGTRTIRPPILSLIMGNLRVPPDVSTSKLGKQGLLYRLLRIVKGWWLTNSV